MTTIDKALSLAEIGMWVFPVSHDVEENTKKPLTEHGHLDATQDPNVITDWWVRWPDAKIGVDCGRSGLVVCDVDTKNGKDGWNSLEEMWVDLPDTFSYDTGTGGTHLVYADPGNLRLDPKGPYRGMEGVDRRAGSSWVMWVGSVPENRDEFASAPEWLLDEAKERMIDGFEGSISEWYASLVPGDPNVMVRRAIDRINPDMGHSDMVAATYEAIRLGAEGATGVPDLIDALENAWMNRPAENHTTPEGEWGFKFQEALLGGIEKYGDAIDLFKNLPEYTINLVPKGVSDNLVVTPGGKTEFSLLLGELIRGTEDDNRVLSILWNAPATKDISRDWGLQFVYKRIQEARTRPEPIRENPRIEEKREEVEKTGESDLSLLTEEEREYLKNRPTFVDEIRDVALSLGYDQTEYFESIAWNMASLAFGRKGFIPVSATQKHGVNLWQIVMGGSGTGKSVADSMQTQVLDLVMVDDKEIPYDLGSDSSIQGLHLALLQRDELASLFSADEASGWFKRLKTNDWATGLEDTLADWYMGRVSPSNKINLKELRGKSAKTSFNLHMFATPERLMETLTREQFMSGFLARVMWTFGNPREVTEGTFEIFKDSSEEIEDVEIASPVIQEIASNLITARAIISKSIVLRPSAEARKRFAQTYEKMFRALEGKKNWDVIEPALTRHMEAMVKSAGVCAMYRGDNSIELVDALHGIRAVEKWVKNLIRVAEMVSAGDFQRKCDELEVFLRQSGGSATGAKIFHRFGNWIVRDAKEIDNVLTYLIQAGIVNRNDTKGVLKYELNGTD